MALADHFRELRARLMKSVLALVVATIASFFFYDQLLELVTGPFNDARDRLGSSTNTVVQRRSLRCRPGSTKAQIW